MALRLYEHVYIEKGARDGPEFLFLNRVSSMCNFGDWSRGTEIHLIGWPLPRDGPE